MKKKIIFGCWVWFLLTALTAVEGRGDIVPGPQIDLYAAKLGVQPQKETLAYDSDRQETRFRGKVVEPCKLTDLGFDRVQAGDEVAITSLENGRWRGKILSTGQERTFPLEIGWNKKG